MKRLAALAVALLLTGCACRTTEPVRPDAPEIMASAPETTQTAPQTTVPQIPETTLPEPEDGELVKVQDWIPGLFVDLRYAGERNFTGRKIYDFQEAYLRYGTVKKLREVCRELEDMNLSLLIWDAFRPVSAQFTLWEVYPDGNFVANPNKTFSSHSRGNTLDVTLTDREGEPLEMPTEFDDFSLLADRDYSDCPLAAAENARLLQQIMERHGFTGYQKEWWHFTDAQTYDVITSDP